jgi:hypothetical protein
MSTNDTRPDLAQRAAALANVVVCARTWARCRAAGDKAALREAERALVAAVRKLEQDPQCGGRRG